MCANRGTNGVPCRIEGDFMLKKTHFYSLKIYFLILVILSALLLPAVAANAANEQAQLAVYCKIDDQPVARASISIYRIGDVTDSTLLPEAPYNELDLPVVQASSSQTDIAAATAALQAYVEEHHVSSTAVKTTDAQGKALFTSVEIGAYLVLADFSESDTKNASALPALVFVLPGHTDGTEIYLKIEVSEESTVPAGPGGVTTPDKPTSVTERFPTAVTRPDRPTSVTERTHTEWFPTNVTRPERPTSETEQAQTEINPTDVTKPEKPTSQEERLPYTGQLWWPVFALAAAGLICFAVGFAACKKNRETER